MRFTPKQIQRGIPGVLFYIFPMLCVAYFSPPIHDTRVYWMSATEQIQLQTFQYLHVLYILIATSLLGYLLNSVAAITAFVGLAVVLYSILASIVQTNGAAIGGGYWLLTYLAMSVGYVIALLFLTKVRGTKS